MMSEAEALERLGSSANYLNRVNGNGAASPPPKENVTIAPLHPTTYHPRLTDAERAAVGVAARLTSPSKAAKEFGVSFTTAARAAEGKTSAGDEVPAVKTEVQSRLEAVATQAIDRLVAALNGLTDEKIEKEKATGISKIASDMAGVVEKVTPKNKEADNVQVVIYAPQVREERDYETIDVRAKVVDERSD